MPPACPALERCGMWKLDTADPACKVNGFVQGTYWPYKQDLNVPNYQYT